MPVNVDYANIGTGSGTKIPGVATSGTLGLLKLLGLSNPWAAGIALGVEFIPKLLSLFGTKDKDAKRATQTQQAMERAAIQIQDRVKNGTLDPDSALAALEAMQRSATNLSGGKSNQFGRAGVGANIIISQVMANVQGIRNAALGAPFDPSKGFTGAPAFQRDRFATSLRNYLGGAEQGDFIKDSPAGIGFGKFDVGKGFEDISKQVQEQFPIGIESQLRTPEDIEAERTERRVGRQGTQDRIRDLFMDRRA